MPIQDTDLLLIEDTSGASKKIEASKLKANLAANTYNNYKLLVNKPDYSSGFVYAQNMQASVAPTDYMLIERAGVSYKVTGQQIIDYFPSVPAGAAGPIIDVEGNGINVYQTSTITNVSGNLLTFASPNPDLKYFNPGDEVQSGVKVVSTDLAANTMTVDGGSWLGTDGSGNASDGRYEPHQQWSAGATLGDNPSAMFDGVLDNLSNRTLFQNSEEGFILNGDEIKDVTSIGFYWLYIQGDQQNVITINGTDDYTMPKALPGQNGASGFADVTIPQTNITSIFMKAFGSGSTGISGVRINGKILVDTSIPGGGGNTEVTKTVSNYNQLTLASDANLDLFTAGDAINMVDDNGDVASYTPVTSTITNVGLFEITDPATTLYEYNGSGNTAYEDLPRDINDSNGTSFTHFQPEQQRSYIGWSNLGIGNTYSLWISAFSPTTAGSIPNINCDSSVADLSIYNPSGILLDSGNSISSPSSKRSTNEAWRLDITTKTNAGRVNLYNANQSHVIWATTLQGGSSLLSFASPNKDLKYFKPGDNVGSLQNPVATFTSSSGSFKEGGISNYNSSNTIPYVANTDVGGGSLGSRYLDLTFASPINVSSTVAINIGIDDTSQAVSINGGSYTSNWVMLEPSRTYLQTILFSGSLNSIRVSSTNDRRNAGRIAYVEIDGGMLELAPPLSTSTSSPQTASSSVQSPILVVSTDTVGNTMTVDGGAWTGSDGTSSGDAADRETEVTGPAKSGTGNFAGNTGPVVDVSNSNQEWVDNTNRLGEEFFIKPTSTRTGLAILRTKAIAQAQVWSAYTNYESKQLVKHNGRYWLALSASYANSPDETDTSDWFDLGLES